MSRHKSFYPSLYRRRRWLFSSWYTWLRHNGTVLAPSTYQSLPCHNTIGRDHSRMRQEWRRMATVRSRKPRPYSVPLNYGAQSRSRAWSWFPAVDLLAEWSFIRFTLHQHIYTMKCVKLSRVRCISTISKIKALIVCSSKIDNCENYSYTLINFCSTVE